MNLSFRSNGASMKYFRFCLASLHFFSLLHGTTAQDVESSLLSPYTETIPTGPTLIELAASMPHLSTLVSAKHSADFASLLHSSGNFTFFAPDNSAFAYLQHRTPQLAQAIFTAPWLDHLQNLLAFHIVNEEKAIASSNIQETTAVQTLNGDSLYLTPYKGSLYIWPALHGGYARVVTPDNGSSNGIAHYVDSILLPGWLTRSLWQVISSDAKLSTFRELVLVAGMDSMLHNDFGLTLLAPTNAAFAKVDANTMEYMRSRNGKAYLKNLIEYHIVPQVLPSYMIPIGISQVPTKCDGVDLQLQGDHQHDDEHDNLDEGEVTHVTFNNDGTSIEAFDILASNGIQHVMDAVLLPQTNDFAHTTRAKDIVHASDQPDIQKAKVDQDSENQLVVKRAQQAEKEREGQAAVSQNTESFTNDESVNFATLQSLPGKTMELTPVATGGGTKTNHLRRRRHQS